eukprot:365757-Chlamydomonas_euryale.AAC.2
MSSLGGSRRGSRAVWPRRGGVASRAADPDLGTPPPRLFSRGHDWGPPIPNTGPHFLVSLRYFWEVTVAKPVAASTPRPTTVTPHLAQAHLDPSGAAGLGIFVRRTASAAGDHSQHHPRRHLRNGSADGQAGVVWLGSHLRLTV